MRELSNLEQLTDFEKHSLILELSEDLQKTESEMRRLKELQKIFKLWVRLKQKSYPARCCGADIRGIWLEGLDSDMAGCVSTFLITGQLNQEQKEALYYCNDCLNTVTLELQGYEGWYFRQLKSLASAIIVYEANVQG